MSSNLYPDGFVRFGLDDYEKRDIIYIIFTIEQTFYKFPDPKLNRYLKGVVKRLKKELEDDENL